MHFTKVRPGHNVDMKATIIRQYLSPRGNKFRDVDHQKIEIEKNVKYAPVSMDQMTVQCKNDIAQCTTLNQLKDQLNKGKDDSDTDLSTENNT